MRVEKRICFKLQNGSLHSKGVAGRINTHTFNYVVTTNPEIYITLPDSQGSNLKHSLRRNLKCMYQRQENNQCLSYTTTQKKWGPWARYAQNKTPNILVFTTASHDDVFTRPEVKILWLEKVWGQISIWKCDIKTVNIYSAHMETFNQVNANLIFIVSWREMGFLSLCPFNKR